MRLISMVDYVLLQVKECHLDENRFGNNVVKYAKLLKTPLLLGQFIPCDLEGNVLEEPFALKTDGYIGEGSLTAIACEQYQQAQERKMFNKNLLSLYDIHHFIKDNKTIEYLRNYHYEKTN